MPFIFPRRHIQKCLDTLRRHLTVDQHASLAARLNRRSPDRIAAMWEAVILTCFADLPGFAHEMPLPNGRTPDFRFLLPETKTLVVGDVTSVSDRGAKKDSPIELLMEDIDRIAKKYDSDLSQFDVYVHAADVGEYRKRRVVLKLPKGSDRERFLKDKLAPYIRERLRREDYGHKKIFSSSGYHIEVTFKEKSQYASYGHPSFTSVLHIDRNAVWNALKAKAEQLRSAQSATLRLLILCDGGCEAMRERGLSSPVGRDEIVREFLRRETGIDIVITMTVKDVRGLMGQTQRIHQWSWAVKQAWLQSDARNQLVAVELQKLICAFGDGVPKPASNPESSVKNCLTMDYGIGSWGGYRLSHNKIEISVRALQRVLAGEVSIEKFNSDHGWPNGNRFAMALSEGRTISNVSMSRRDENDDDYVEITFAPDAALSPFR
ncbi:MAG: hypothetical protein HC844_17500 [Tabrizicola sp.]|nr:hypothetical protein [Tabrizicola sp.]